MMQSRRHFMRMAALAALVGGAGITTLAESLVLRPQIQPSKLDTIHNLLKELLVSSEVDLRYYHQLTRLLALKLQEPLPPTLYAVELDWSPGVLHGNRQTGYSLKSVYNEALVGYRTYLGLATSRGDALPHADLNQAFFTLPRRAKAHLLIMAVYKHFPLRPEHLDALNQLNAPYPRNGRIHTEVSISIRQAGDETSLSRRSGYHVSILNETRSVLQFTLVVDSKTVNGKMQELSYDMPGPDPEIPVPQAQEALAVLMP